MRRTRSGRGRLGSVAGLLAAAVMVSGCGGGAAAQSAPACRKLPPADLPHSAGTLTQDDSGTYCLPAGQQVDVFLRAPGTGMRQSARWSPIATSMPKLLAPTNNGVLTAALGVTPGIFVGTARGTAQLTSRTPGGKSWHATIVVR